MTNPVEFNFGDDDTWVAGDDQGGGVWTKDHTYADSGSYTVTARAGAYEATDSFTAEVPVPAAPVITAISPSDTIAQGATLTITGTGFTDKTQFMAYVANNGSGQMAATFVNDTTVTVLINAGDTITSVQVTERVGGQDSNVFPCSLVVT